MHPEQPRTAANSRERSPDHQFSLSVEQAADLYTQAGHARTHRAIQKYCALSKLDCRKVETEVGEKYFIAPYSVERHIAYINEVRTVANSRDHSRTVANVRTIQDKDISNPDSGSQSEQPRTAANANPDERYQKSLERENTFLRDQIVVKDTQIKDLTERARETNVLINGLQKMLSPLLVAPHERSASPPAESPQS